MAASWKNHCLYELSAELLISSGCPGTKASPPTAASCALRTTCSSRAGRATSCPRSAAADSESCSAGESELSASSAKIAMLPAVVPTAIVWCRPSVRKEIASRGRTPEGTADSELSDPAVCCCCCWPAPTFMRKMDSSSRTSCSSTCPLEKPIATMSIAGLCSSATISFPAAAAASSGELSSGAACLKSAAPGKVWMCEPVRTFQICRLPSEKPTRTLFKYAAGCSSAVARRPSAADGASGTALVRSTRCWSLPVRTFQTKSERPSAESAQSVSPKTSMRASGTGSVPMREAGEDG